jgi:hypothetical protein
MENEPTVEGEVITIKVNHLDHQIVDCNISAGVIKNLAKVENGIVYKVIDKKTLKVVESDIVVKNGEQFVVFEG